MPRVKTACLLVALACACGEKELVKGPADTPKEPIAMTEASKAPLGGLPAPPISEATTPASPAQIAAGDYHTCARMSDATVRCWGRNREGQLGDGTTADKTNPTIVPGLHDVTAVTGGASYTCALTLARTVVCWGTGDLVGRGGSSTFLVPTAVPFLADVAEIDAGGLLICARTGAGAVHCWGTEKPPPGGGPAERLAVAAGAVQISAGEAHACARMDSGKVRCWGDGSWSETAPRSFAHPALAGNALDVSTGDSVACATIPGGLVQCWGRNEQGELGVAPDMDPHDVPVTLPKLAGVTSVVAGEAHLCAILGDMTARCWGSDTDGELGRDLRSGSERPGPLGDLREIAEITLGADHGCARTTHAEVACWGSNGNGQLGDGTKERRMRPTRVAF